MSHLPSPGNTVKYTCTYFLRYSPCRPFPLYLYLYPSHSSGRVCVREKKRYREVMSTSSLWWWWWLSEMLCALNSLYYFPLSLFALCTLLVILLLPTPVRHCHQWLDLTGPHRTKFFPFWTLNGYPIYLYYFVLDDTFLGLPSGSYLSRWCTSSSWYLLDHAFVNNTFWWNLLDHAFQAMSSGSCLLDQAFWIIPPG